MISDYLIVKLDGVTTKLQRRGYRLTSMQVVALGAVLFLTTFGHWWDGSPIHMVINGVCWGVSFWNRAKWAEVNKDYPESIKTMNKLNAEALWWREGGARWLHVVIVYFAFFMLGMAAPLLVFDFKVGTLCFALAWIAIPVAILLHCCTFIGPGEFAKQQEDSKLHNAVGSKS